MNNNAKSIGAHSAIILFWGVVIILFLWAPFFISNMYKQKSLTVLAWPGLLDVQYLQKFEEKTGIKVNVRYFESNEELFLKIKETKGKGYDLIMPSDYMTDLMVKEGLLKKIDKKKLLFFDQLNPHLVGKYYDKNNDYSIPFFWSMYGIAIDKDYFKDKEINRSWALVFDPKYMVPHTCVIDDVRELILMAAQYLYGKQDTLNESQLQEIKELLIAQKKLIEVYAEDRANTLLASKICPVAIILSAVVARIMAVYPNIEFIVPQEGGFLLIDSFAMPKATKNDELVYEFLNFMYEPETINHHTQMFGFFSPIKGLENEFSLVVQPTDKQLEKADFFKNSISHQQLSDILIALKS